MRAAVIVARVVAAAPAPALARHLSPRETVTRDPAPAGSGLKLLCEDRVLVTAVGEGGP